MEFFVVYKFVWPIFVAMKGTSKMSEKSKVRVFYDEDGKPVKGRFVEEESSAGESYEYGKGGRRDMSKHYEYAKAGRDYHSWADESERGTWNKDEAVYDGDYYENRDEGRWVDRSGKGRASRGQSRPPAVRVASPPEDEERTVRYRKEPPSSSRGLAHYAPSSGKGSKGSEWHFEEPERTGSRGGTAQTRAPSRAVPERKMPSRVASRTRPPWKEDEDEDMPDPPKEVIDVDAEDKGTRSKSVVRSPWPEGHKKIGPASPPPKDEVSDVAIRVLKAAQDRIDAIQAEQLKDEEDGCYLYEVAIDRSRTIKGLIREAVATCGGFLTPPMVRPELKLTDVLKFKLSRDVQGNRGKVHYCSYCGSPFHSSKACDDARNMTDPGRHALAIPDKTSVTGFENRDYPGYGTRLDELCTPRNYDLYYTLRNIRVDKQYNIWIYPFDVPVAGGVSAEDQLRRLGQRTGGTRAQESHLLGPVDFLLRIRGLLDPRSPFLRVTEDCYFAAWLTGQDEDWARTPSTFDNWKPDDLVLSRSAPAYSLEGAGQRTAPSGSRSDYSFEAWMSEPRSRTVGTSSAAASGGPQPPLPGPAAAPPAATPQLPADKRKSVGDIVDDKVKAAEKATSSAAKDGGRRAQASSAAIDASFASSRHMLPTGLELNGNKRRMYDVESVAPFLQFLGSCDKLGKDEIVDLAQKGYATAGQFGVALQSTVTSATGHGSLAVDLFEEDGIEKFRVSSIVQLAAEITADRSRMLNNPDALEELMAKHLADVLRDVFGSKWSRMCQGLRDLSSTASSFRVDLPAVVTPKEMGAPTPALDHGTASGPGVDSKDVHMGVASPTQSLDMMNVDAGQTPRKWTFSFGGAYCRTSADAYKATQPGDLCVFAVYRVDLSPVKEGPELDSWIRAAGQEVEDPVRCRFLVTRSAENRFKTIYPTETDEDFSSFATDMVIAVNEVRLPIGLPSLVLYKEEQLEPSTVGQWRTDEVEPASRNLGQKAIVGILRFTGDETVYAPLRIQGCQCEIIASKGRGMPIHSGTASKPELTDRGFPMLGRGRVVRGNFEDCPDDTSTRIPDDPDDRSPASEDFAPHWVRGAMLKDLEGKSVYEAEDMVIDRFASSEGDVTSGAMKRVPYVTTLCLGPRPALSQGLSTIGSGNPVYERTIVCIKRFGRPTTWSGDGIPFYGINTVGDSWHVQGAESRGVAVAAKPPPLPATTKEQAVLMKRCLTWETEPMEVECAVDAFKRDPLKEMIVDEVEVVNFWAAPQSDTPKVSEKLINALSTRMNFEELRILPKVVFVGMKREVSHSGNVSLYRDDLYHIACALLAPVRVYGYQKSSKGTCSGQTYVYVDFVCGSCGAIVSMAWPVDCGVWPVEYWEKNRGVIYNQVADSDDFKAHLAGTKCLARWLEYGEPMTSVGGVPLSFGTGMRHMTRVTSRSPFVTTVKIPVKDSSGKVVTPRVFWAPVCGQGCPIPSLECVRDMLGYPELMIPLVRDALMLGRIHGFHSSGRYCQVTSDDVLSVEAGLVLWDLNLLSGGQDWSDDVLKDAEKIPNRMYNDKRIRLVGMSSLPATNTEWFAKTGIQYPSPDFPQPQLGKRGAERTRVRMEVYSKFNFGEKPKRAHDLEPELDDTMSSLATDEGNVASSRLKRFLRDPDGEDFGDKRFYLRQDLGENADAMRAFREAFPPGDEDMGWYAVVTIRMKPDSGFVGTLGKKILVICWVQIIQDGDGRIIGWTWDGPEIQVPLDYLRGHGRMVL